PFYVTHCVLSEMENAGGQDRVRLSLKQHVSHMLQGSGPAARDHGNPNRFADTPRDLQIESSFRSVRVNAVQNNLSSSHRHGAFGPFDRVQPGGFAASMREDSPLARRALLRVN